MPKEDEKEKTYEELIEEAIQQVSIYSKEWTNYNISDPAVTILENLTALNFLQRMAISQITEEEKRCLLRLAGFAEQPGQSARVLVKAEHVEEEVFMPAGQRFMVGKVCFETNRQTGLSGHRLIAAYGRQKETLFDYSCILEEQNPSAVSVFGKEPSAGFQFYLVTSGLPDRGKLFCYVSVKETAERNPPDKKEEVPFAKIQWQCYTKAGYVDITCQDQTRCLTRSGELTFLFPDSASVCKTFPAEGYVICGTLQKAEYDIAPVVFSFTGFLFEVWQKESKAVCQTYYGSREFSVFCDLLEEGYFHLYCREGSSGSYIRLPLLEEGKQGIGYRQIRLGYGMYRFMVSGKEGTEEKETDIKLVVYTEQTMQQYYLDTIYGYDKQKIAISFTDIVPESFMVVAERKDKQGIYHYEFIRPNQQEEGMLYYQLLDTEGELQIIDAGDFLDAKLYLASVSVTRGEEGNITGGKQFIPVGYESEILFTNPGPGTGGRHRESLEEVKKRFAEDVNMPAVPVTDADYERIVKHTPELVIQKVKAVSRGQQVKIMVLPYAEKEYPRLSESYKRVIWNYLEQRRLLNVKITLEGPSYLPIQVQGVIYGKKHDKHCRERIEEEIRHYLDYRAAERQFGEMLHIEELYQRVEQLSCVSYIYELFMMPQISGMAVMMGNDIKLNDACLCCSGNITLEIR